MYICKCINDFDCKDRINVRILQTYTYLDVNNNKNEGFIITENAKNSFEDELNKWDPEQAAKNAQERFKSSLEAALY